MPNRILKESVTTSYEVDNLTADEERFFYRLIVVCDDYCRMDARLSVLRAKCFPLKIDIIKDKDIKRWLSALQKQNLIKLYEIDGKNYIQMTTWEAHQQVRAKRSKFPAPDGGVIHRISDVPVEISSDIKCDQMISNVPVFVFENPIRESESLSESRIVANPIKLSTGPQKSSKEFADTSLENFLARKLKSYILANNPKAMPPRDLTKWCTEFDKIIRIDGRTLDDIEAVMAYSQSDPFWMANVLSPKKLREHFDKLYLQAKNPRNKASPATRTEPQAWSNIREWLKDSEEADNRDPPGI